MCAARRKRGVDVLDAVSIEVSLLNLVLTKGASIMVIHNQVAALADDEFTPAGPSFRAVAVTHKQWLSAGLAAILPATKRKRKLWRPALLCLEIRSDRPRQKRSHASE